MTLSRVEQFMVDGLPTSLEARAPAAITPDSLLAGNASGDARINLTFDQVRAALRSMLVVETLAAAKAADVTKDRAMILHDGVRDSLYFWHPENLSARVVKTTIVPTTVQPSTDNFILTNHGLMTGNAVLTTTAVNGLTANTLYYVIRLDANNFKLAASIANAFAGTAVDVTGSAAVTFKRMADPANAVYIVPTGKAYDGSEGAWVKDGKVLTPQMFGAKGDYGETNTNDHDAIQLWFQTLLCLDDFGYSGLLAARYYLTRDLILQLTELSTEARGLAIRVQTRNHDGFYLANGFRFELSNPNSQALFYIVFEARVAGNINDSQLVTFGIGDFSDAFNSCDVDMVVNNAGTGATKALVINAMHQSRLKLVVNGNGSGRPISQGGLGPSSVVGVWFRQLQFSHVSLAAGNAGTGLRLSDGFNFSNTFDGSLDIEEVDTGVVIADANTNKNTFLGGTIVSKTAFNSSAGSNVVNDDGLTYGQYTGWSKGTLTGLKKFSTAALT